MEHLPRDAIQCVLRKLANQDPFSLLQATWTCRLFEKTAEQAPVIWREAFLAPEPESTGNSSACGISNGVARFDGLDAEIASLGGYKQLALMKIRYLQKIDLSLEQKQTEPLTVGEQDDRLAGGSKERVSRYLLLFRFRGRLIGWSAFSPEKDSHLEMVNLIAPKLQNSYHLGLRVVNLASERYACSDSRPKWINDVSNMRTGGTSRGLREGKVSSQIYAFQHHEANDLSNRLVARTGSPWHFTYDDDVPFQEGEPVQYDLPGFKAKVYLVSRESSQPNTATGCEKPNDKVVNSKVLRGRRWRHLCFC